MWGWKIVIEGAETARTDDERDQEWIAPESTSSSIPQTQSEWTSAAQTHPETRLSSPFTAATCACPAKVLRPGTPAAPFPSAYTCHTFPARHFPPSPTLPTKLSPNFHQTTGRPPVRCCAILSPSRQLTFAPAAASPGATLVQELSAAVAGWGPVRPLSLFRSVVLNSEFLTLGSTHARVPRDFGATHRRTAAIRRSG